MSTQPVNCTKNNDNDHVIQSSPVNYFINKPKPNCVGVSSQEIRAFPRAGPRKRLVKRQRVKRRILISTPIKYKITA